MAKLRYLKKDINYLTNDLIDECLVFLALNKKADEKKVDEVIKKVLNKRIDLIRKVNKIRRNKEIPAHKQVDEIITEAEKEMIGALDDLKEMA